MKRFSSPFALVAALAALPAAAAVKYWDNPAFKAYDVGDYVQDGLVLHYDGIRNAGADAAHSDAAVTWANLASDGEYPLGWYSWVKQGTADSYAREDGNTANGAWTANGFAFDGLEGFAATKVSFSMGPAYTLQFDTAFTDDASVAERYGIALTFREGERFNLKITTPEDLILAKAILSQHD